MHKYKGFIIEETWSDEGCISAYMFDASGKSLNGNPAVAEFMNFYKQRLNKSAVKGVISSQFGCQTMVQTVPVAQERI